MELNLGALQTRKKEIQNMPKGQIKDKVRAAYEVAGSSSLTWFFIIWNTVPMYLYEHC